MLLRRLRAVLVTSLLWGAFWAVPGTLIGLLLFGLWTGAPLAFLWTNLPRTVLSGFLFGLMSGATFAVIIAIAERKHTFGELTRVRMTMWGLLAVVVVSAIGFLRLAMALTSLDLSHMAEAGLSLSHFVVMLLAKTVVVGILGATMSAAHFGIAKRLTMGEGEPPLMLGDSAT